MAVCEIWDVKGRLDHPIDYAENPEKTANPKYTDADLQAMGDVMKYATNGDKTERQFFVTGVNCDPATARDEMMMAKAQWNDQSEIVCYHGFQSFKHGEVTPEVAHEVGVKLAEKMWGERFQVIVATHLNTECLHNHFVVNSVSYIDGRHYHDNKKNLRLLRQRSDELCREYSLSVIEHPSGRKKPYVLCQAEKNGLPTRDSVARQAVDEAISKSFTLKDFDRQLSEMGYRINFDPNRKYWTIIGKGWQRPKRLYKLGGDYTNERITERIRENSYAVKFQNFSREQPQVKVYRVRGSLKDDLLKMEAITNETRLLCRNHIDTAGQLLSYKGSLESEMQELTEHRKGLYSQSRKASGKEKEAVKARLSEITGRMKTLRREVRLCEGIDARSDTLKENLNVIRADEKEKKGKELMKHEHRRRSGGANRKDELGGI